MNKYILERLPHSIVFAKTVESLSLDYLFLNHKINFDGKRPGSGVARHTSLDWFLSPVERPSIEKAEVKENYIEIPGTNGGLDLTESLTGSPLYDYIEGSFEFKILNDRKLPILNNKCELVSEKEISWEYLNRDIRAFLNGKERYMMFEDDPSWYYKGRFTVGRYDSSESANSKIVIEYKVYPFKRLCTNFTEKLETYFDAQPLRVDDTNKLMVSFWNAKDINLKPGESKYFAKSELPCGDEDTQLIFEMVKRTDAFKLYANLKTYKENKIIKEMESEIPGEADPTGKTTNEVRVRGFVLTNNYHRNIDGAYHSDNSLNLFVSYPNDISVGSPYEEGSIVSYTSNVEGQENIEWILKAKEEILLDWDTMDFSKWEVDTAAMNVKEFSEQSTYSTGSLVYKIDNDIITLYKALESTTGEWDESKWTDEIDITADNVYGYVTVNLLYQIGVM